MRTDEGNLCDQAAEAGMYEDGEHHCGKDAGHEPPHRCIGCNYEWSDSPGGSWDGSRTPDEPNWLQRWLARR